MYPLANAEVLRDSLVGVPGGARLFSVKCASRIPSVTMPTLKLTNAIFRLSFLPINSVIPASSGFVTIMSSSIVNQVFSKFLLTQPHARSDLNTTKQSLRDAMEPALSRLASFKVDSSILTRDPHSPLSFSCTPLEQAQAQEAKTAAYAKGQRKAFSPLGADGRPLRK